MSQISMIGLGIQYAYISLCVTVAIIITKRADELATQPLATAFWIVLWPLILLIGVYDAVRGGECRIFRIVWQIIRFSLPITLPPKE